MHVQTHMSGHVSRQVPNQAGPQLPSLAQQNGGPLPSQIQNLNMYPDLISARSLMQRKILEKLQQQQTFPEMQPRMGDIVRRLEEYLFKTASSKEEYTNMETLEQRLQTLIKRLPIRNHIQQSAHLLSSSSSIGAMIPTPGMPHSGNSSANIASSVDNYMIASSECNNSISATTVNTGSLLPTANGSNGGIHGGSFNACDGILPNGYQQSPSNISVGSAANNFIASMSVPRMASQMIPTPGYNNIQSTMNSESSNNGGGFSSVESAALSQSQQQKQYGGGQNSRILQNLSSQMGIGMRSNLQQKSSIYGFSNGSLNDVLGLTGNNVQAVNGVAASEGYVTASPYGNSPNPIQQHFDPQRQQLMQTLSQQLIPSAGDGCGVSSIDLSGSGNFYSPAASVGSSLNNQNTNPVSLQGKTRINPMIANQPNTQSIQQRARIKRLPIEQLSNMNFQSPHSNREHLLQSHQLQKFPQQQFSQQHHQFQLQQFVHLQQQPKQQSQLQQQPLLLKSEALSQSQLASSIGGQVMHEHGMESHGEASHAQVSEQFHFAELQNQYQQNSSTGAQLLSNPSGPQDYCSSISQNSQPIQHLFHPQQQVMVSQDDFNCLPSGAQPDALQQGQWHHQSQRKSLIPDPLSHEQHVQDDSSCCWFPFL